MLQVWVQKPENKSRLVNLLLRLALVMSDIALGLLGPVASDSADDAVLLP